MALASIYRFPHVSKIKPSKKREKKSLSHIPKKNKIYSLHSLKKKNKLVNIIENILKINIQSTFYIKKILITKRSNFNILLESGYNTW